MRLWRGSIIGAFALVLAGGMAAPALAAPAQAAPPAARHCLVDVAARAQTCTSSVEEVLRLAAAAGVQPLVTFHDGFDYTGSSATYSNVECSGSTSDIDYGWRAIPFPLSGAASSITKYSAGQCNWQLRGPNGGTSTWVEGSRADLRALGDGWSNRAVEMRLT